MRYAARTKGTIQWNVRQSRSPAMHVVAVQSPEEMGLDFIHDKIINLRSGAIILNYINTRAGRTG